MHVLANLTEDTKGALADNDLSFDFFELRAFDARDTQKVFGALEGAGGNDRFGAFRADAGKFFKVGLRRSVDVHADDFICLWRFAHGVGAHRSDENARPQLLKLLLADALDSIQFVNRFVRTACDDFLREFRADSRQSFESFARRIVDIDPRH